MKLRVMTGVHSPDQFRVQVLHLETFGQFFNGAYLFVIPES